MPAKADGRDGYLTRPNQSVHVLPIGVPVSSGLSTRAAKVIMSNTPKTAERGVFWGMSTTTKDGQVVPFWDILHHRPPAITPRYQCGRQGNRGVAAVAQMAKGRSAHGKRQGIDVGRTPPFPRTRGTTNLFNPTNEPPADGYLHQWQQASRRFDCHTTATRRQMREALGSGFAYAAAPAMIA
ncbi:hypothetical protein GGTG_04839 [Gaeumannomyces tritici R3-111a-1]|uniref:Uncharacterized protein n=1 Tax=Gaeumannomyces tritici (strain R3-111a-1) TaxID=644352 RepID=J3NU84_GAET3|nr:hypothetical protein GGTG_04839 [Gaeumannomyces tritici R3-111a-1]EJT79755.1 hypothetical protein GGTG_04839 [Gaeumannomyces tritici R3-111a-1]